MRNLMVTVLLGTLAVPAWAQDPGDAPDHGVARISLLSGDVTVRRGDSGEDVAAEVNAPLVARDHVFTEQGSRAEIQFDSANFLRLAPESEVRLAELAARDFLVQLSAGTLTFRVLGDSDAQAEISTPTLSLRPRREGSYRITVNDDNSTEVTVRSGEAEIFVGGKTDYLRSGQTLMVNGDPSDPERRYLAAIPRDEWDRWNESRDRDRDRSDSYKYVNRHIYGAEDLYGHGRWVYDPPYGWVWVPNVSVSWAPYRVGRWVWVDFYGWTWVSGDPWGWAPYHYGRWYHAPRYGWVWYPGEARVRYYWRPALVVFFGWGSNVGWVALAPHETYRPWYGPNRTIIVNNNVTVVNNINVVNTYRNARFVSGRNGVTSVGSGDFGRRSITVNNFVVANNRDLERAGDASRWLPKEPSRENRQFSNRVASAHSSSRPDVDRKFVTRPDRNNNSNPGRGDGRTEPRGDARVQPNPSTDNRGRGNDSRRNETVTLPRNEQERGRQPENNRGGAADNSAASRGNARVQPNTSTASRGRGNDSRQNETVVFPRNEQGRGRQPENNRGGEADNSAGSRGNARVQPNTSSDSVRRGNDSRQNETVVFPRNEQERGRQPESSRGREADNSAGSRGNARVQPNTSSDSVRRGNDSRQNETVVFPRNEQERGRPSESSRGRTDTVAPRNERPQQPEADRGRNEGSVRAPAEARRESPPETRGRSSQPSENSRRPEPAVRTAPDAAPPRSEPSRSQPPQSRAPQSAPSAPAPSAREQSRGRSAPQSSSSSGKKTEEDSDSGRGRGRDER